MQPFNNPAGQQSAAYGQMYNSAGFPQQQWNQPYQGTQPSSTMQNQSQQGAAQPVYKSFPGYGGSVAPSSQDASKQAVFAPPYATQSQSGQQGQQPGPTQQAPGFGTVQNPRTSQNPQSFQTPQSFQNPTTFQNPQARQQSQSAPVPVNRPSGQSVYELYNPQSGQPSNAVPNPQSQPAKGQGNAAAAQNDLPPWTPDWSPPQASSKPTEPSGAQPTAHTGGQLAGQSGGLFEGQASGQFGGQIGAQFGGQARGQTGGQFGGQSNAGQIFVQPAGGMGGQSGGQAGVGAVGQSTNQSTGQFPQMGSRGGQVVGQSGAQSNGQWGGQAWGQGVGQASDNSGRQVRTGDQSFGTERRQQGVPFGGSQLKGQAGGQQNLQSATQSSVGAQLGSQSGGASVGQSGGPTAGHYGHFGGQTQSSGGAQAGAQPGMQRSGQQGGQSGGQSGAQFGGRYGGQSSGQAAGQSSGQFAWLSGLGGQSAGQPSQAQGGAFGQQSSGQSTGSGRLGGPTTEQLGGQGAGQAVGQAGGREAQYNEQTGAQTFQGGGQSLPQRGGQPGGQFGGQSVAHAGAQSSRALGPQPTGQMTSQSYGASNPQQSIPVQSYGQGSAQQSGVQSWQQSNPPSGQREQRGGKFVQPESPLSPAHPPGYSPRVPQGGLSSGGNGGQARFQGGYAGPQAQQFGGGSSAGPSGGKPTHQQLEVAREQPGGAYGHPATAYGQAGATHGQPGAASGEQGSTYGQPGGTQGPQGSTYGPSGAGGAQGQQGSTYGRPGNTYGQSESAQAQPKKPKFSRADASPKIPLLSASELEGLHKFVEFGEKVLQQVGSAPPVVSRQSPAVSRPSPAVSGQPAAVNQPLQAESAHQGGEAIVRNMPEASRWAFGMQAPRSMAVKAEDKPEIQPSFGGNVPAGETPAREGETQTGPGQQPGAQVQQLTAQAQAAFPNPYAMFERKSGPAVSADLPHVSPQQPGTIGANVLKATEKTGTHEGQKAFGVQQSGQGQPNPQQGLATAVNPQQASGRGQQAMQRGQNQQPNFPAQANQGQFMQQGQAQQQFGVQSGQLQQGSTNQPQFRQPSPNSQAQFTQPSPNPHAQFQQQLLAGQMNQPQALPSGQLHQPQMQLGAQIINPGFQQPSPQPGAQFNQLLQQQQANQSPFQQQFSALPTAFQQQGAQGFQNQAAGQRQFAAPSFVSQAQAAPQGLQNQGSGQQQFGVPAFGSQPQMTPQNSGSGQQQFGSGGFGVPPAQSDAERRRQQAMAILAQQEKELQEKRSQQGRQKAQPTMLQSPTKQNTSLTPLQQLAALRKLEEDKQRRSQQGGQPAQLPSPAARPPQGQPQPLIASPAPNLPPQMQPFPAQTQQAFGGQPMGTRQLALGQNAPGQVGVTGLVGQQFQGGIPGKSGAQQQTSGGQGFGPVQSFGQGQVFGENQAFGQGGTNGQGQAGIPGQGLAQASGFGQGQAFGQGQGQGQGFTQGQGFGQGQIQNQGFGQGQSFGQAQMGGQAPFFVQQARPGFQPQLGGTPQVQPGQVMGQQAGPNQGVMQGHAGASFPNQPPTQVNLHSSQASGGVGIRPRMPTGGGFGMAPRAGLVNPPGLSGRPGMIPGGQPRGQGPTPRGAFQAQGRPPQQGVKRPLVQDGGPGKGPTLRCDPCEKEFSGQDGYNAHMVAHEKCSEPGCGFEASGKVLKEHKLSAHQAGNKLGRARAAATANANETEEDVRKWREERRKHYPTEGNVQKKAEEAAARRARGELEDLDGAARRARLREILQQQRALGVVGSETEAAAMLDGGKRQAVEGPGGRPERGVCFFFLKGHCRKGRRCQFLHQRTPRGERGPGGPGNDRRRQNQVAKRAPTLLEKLLAPEIRKDKSHLLQSFRFMVNNNFFLEWPQQPLKYFEWQSSDELEEGGDTGAEGAPEALVHDGKAEGEGTLDEEEEDGSDYESAGEDDEEAALEVMLG
ncbi:Zinc finger domain containing protein [Klebsormidium nitens]|uniref:Zinc finger domain containing protein n=1 Tax=Klebsormidium nitens TaxID=105231 RepID=A0A1Y1IAQ5_KLENI|nr:Zinc finger domain containing protein [Klebsormidium nitens]|eukprot:GAQ88045.1 Zinc finger domain containing protein [Klebsormidium nitens]